MQELNNNQNVLGDDLNKLKEDMAWINLQIDQNTPLKTENENTDGLSASAATPSQTTSTPNTPYDVGDKGHLKKSKGNFEFPEGGWECSKCQNYNFKGRKECNRCKKPKTTKDSTGKP